MVKPQAMAIGQASFADFGENDKYFFFLYNCELQRNLF